MPSKHRRPAASTFPNRNISATPKSFDRQSAGSRASAVRRSGIMGVSRVNHLQDARRRMGEIHRPASDGGDDDTRSMMFIRSQRMKVDRGGSNLPRPLTYTELRVNENVRPVGSASSVRRPKPDTLHLSMRRARQLARAAWRAASPFSLNRRCVSSRDLRTRLDFSRAASNGGSSSRAADRKSAAPLHFPARQNAQPILAGPGVGLGSQSSVNVISRHIQVP